MPDDLLLVLPLYPVKPSSNILLISLALIPIPLSAMDITFSEFVLLRLTTTPPSFVYFRAFESTWSIMKPSHILSVTIFSSRSLSSIESFFLIKTID